MVLFAYLGYNCSVRTRGQYEVVPDALPEDQDLFSIELEPVGYSNVPIVDLPSQKRVVVAPFIPAHNLSRGLLQAIHALFSYALMLVAMSVSARYCSPSWMPC